MLQALANDGVRVAIHELGGRGEPLVLVHATGFHGRVWLPLAARLADRFQCISLDLRGHGDSDPPMGDDFDWHDLAIDVLAVVDALGLDQPYGVGHSSGATALLLAEQNRPGAFGALYCFEPVIIPADEPLGRDRGSWLAAAARRRREVFASSAEARKNYASKPPLSVLDPIALGSYVEHGFAQLADGTVRLKCHPEHEALVYETATANDCFDRLGEVACPVTLAAGEASDAFPPAAMAALAARLPCSSTHIIPALGHLGPLEDPAVVAASVRRAFPPKPGPAPEVSAGLTRP